MRLVRDASVDVAICCGSEAWITPLGIGSFSLLRALSTSRNHAPAAASRPFSLDRDGFVPAEGADALVVESAERAARRGASAVAMISGVASTNDAHHPVAPRPDAREAARAITLALQDAGVGPDAVDYINAHGTSTPLNDVAETKALTLALGEAARRIPVSATKSLTGHGLGASGAWEVIATALSVRDQVAHPTINLTEPDPACALNHIVGVSQPLGIRHALKTSFGFGGQNVALVLEAP